jgi:hypothetical protein
VYKRQAEWLPTESIHEAEQIVNSSQGTGQPTFPNNNAGFTGHNRRNNIVVRRDNRCILASQLPTVFVTNHRSFFPKFNNFIDLMKTHSLTLGLHSEIWEVKENRVHQNKIEEALELEGIK